MRLFFISKVFNLFIVFLFVLFFCSCSRDYYSVLWSSPEQEWTSGVEGPAADSKGNVYAVNFKEQGTIGIISNDNKSQIFVSLPEGSIGNGIRFNERGNFYVADYAKHNVLEVNVKTKEIIVYAHNSHMNQPNDLAIAKNVYDLSPRGNISNKRLFYKFQDHGMDGMRCDVKGNLYVTRHGKGTVAILSPDGTLLEEVQLIGQKPTNITFGGSDGKKCYVTLADKGNLESFRSKNRGRETAWIK